MFTVKFHDDAGDELEALPADIAAKMVRLLEKLQENPRSLRGPHCKPLGNGLFEVRTMGGDIARGLWVYQTGKNIFVLRIFIKKTSKTPLAEIDLAFRRLEEMLDGA
ncbi:type II toxin-antitoxin system RelE/ParE family toxin [Pantoea agglomerans]|uniref:type II toxin-antitoxin system RelE/ParE family toxin n=1 Tax=Enterobacter agglomerans TaxID=549 RepID=UPI000B347E30|nr:type II toxin-antitoxin system RelE/ParE family toxin [Pantoea agglomerans]PHP91792.1 type II toxin-antitoxin system RelE/ParE family toxin [Pantoea agglomerans]